MEAVSTLGQACMREMPGPWPAVQPSISRSMSKDTTSTMLRSSAHLQDDAFLEACPLH